jgi:hypothetical protein
MPKAILELEMPESCKQCKLGHYDELYDITHCDILRECMPYEGRHPDCPLLIMKKWNGEGDCKYCKDPSAFLAICQHYETRIFISVSGSYLQIFDEDYPGFCDNHKINFCPMCGRKLS